MIYVLSWKNIWRNKARSFIIIFAVFSGLWGTLFAISILNGMIGQVIKSSIEDRLSHIQIHYKDFLINKHPQLVIPQGEQILQDVQSRDDVQAAAGRTIANGLIASAHTSYGVTIYGVNPEKEKLITNIHKHVIQGTYFQGKKRNQIVMGEKLAKRLGLKLNARVVLTFEHLDKSITGASFRIVGIFRSDSSAFDEANVFLDAKDLRRLSGVENFHEIGIFLKNVNQVPKVQKELKEKYQGSSLDVDSWDEIAPELHLISQINEAILLILISIILFALAFGIVNTMLMAVLERRREFGMLMAIGMQKKRITLMIVTETIMICLTGGFLGMLAGMLTIQSFKEVGVDLSFVAKGLSSYGVSKIIYPSLPLSIYPQLTLVVLIIAVFAALYPAYKGMKVSPVEAIRD